MSLVLLTGLVSVAAGFLAGAYPSRYAVSFPAAVVLKGSFGLSPRGRNLRNLLISIQFVSSIALIIAALFMYLQNRYMEHAPLGYDKDEVIVAGTNNTTVYKSKEAFVNELKSYADISGVTFGQYLLSSADQYMGWSRNFKGNDIHYYCLPVDPSFLDVLGIKLDEGRDFRPDDERTRHGAYIFNEIARKEYGLQVGDRIDSAEVVGFMPDIKYTSFRKAVTPMAFYVWGTQNWGTYNSIAYVKVRAGADMRAAMQYVRKTLKTFSNGFPVNVSFYDEVLDNLYRNEQRIGSLITLFSVLAVFISIVGVFGLVFFESEYRRKEIGIRKVMGSTTGQILALFNRLYLYIVGICFLVAAPIAWYLVGQWLHNFAYRTPMSWWVFALALVLIAAVTALTVTVQNWRAANMNPIDSIKEN
ncbi:MAG: ABC transporter permease [Tannerella sp.]|nr:ABC transporter permease [Tannerella sp.]